jgi:hypothetical protein
MSVAELHPEELFDKLVDGELSGAERDRLVAHLQGCSVCRFDYGARLDFEQEARLAQQRLLPNLPLQPVRAPQAVVTRRRRSRILVWGTFAAVLISGSAALAAALGERQWRALAAMFAANPEPAPASHKVVRGPRSTAAPAAELPPGADTASMADVGTPPRAGAPEPRSVAAAPRALAAGSRSVAAAPRALAPEPRSVAAAPRAAVSRSARGELSRPATPADQGQAGERAPLPSPTRPVSKGLASTQGAEAPVAVAPSEPSSAAKLYAEGNQARRLGQVGRAFTFYQLLQEQHPGSSEAELSRVTVATLLLNGGDASGALKGFERYLAGPSRALEAEALVGRARALQRLGRKQSAAAAWREVQRRFPSSVYARQAAERLTALGPP